MTSKLIRLEYCSDPIIHPESLEQMRQQGGTWAVYQNHDLSSKDICHLKFLKFGPECTFCSPPEHFPANTISHGWIYVFVGTVDLNTGDIKEERETK